MKITYQYRLRPTKQQVTQLEEWLETCRRTYNRMLGERCDWWENNRCYIDRCYIVSCGIAPLKDKPNYYSQQDSLVPLKAKYPDIKLVQSQVLQNVVKRVDLAYERFVSGSSNGKRSGKPRFKGKGRYRSLTFTQMKQTCLNGNRIVLPKLGVFKLVVHRLIPNGFKIKTATVVRQADGWYVSLSLEDTTVPTLSPSGFAVATTGGTPATRCSPNINSANVVGIDVGLKEFLVTSEGETVPIPQFARKSEKRRKVLNKALSRKKKKGTRHRQKVIKQLGRHYQKVARQRKDFHYKTVLGLVSKYDVIAHEDLNIKGLAKTRLSKSILDAGWGEFIAIVTRKAESAGRLTVAVNPYGTTQRCSGCDAVVPKTLSDRWHSCACGVELDRDVNAAINIKKLAAGHSVSKARGDLCSSRSVKREARPIPLCG